MKLRQATGTPSGYLAIAGGGAWINTQWAIKRCTKLYRNLKSDGGPWMDGWC